MSEPKKVYDLLKTASPQTIQREEQFQRDMIAKDKNIEYAKNPENWPDYAQVVSEQTGVEDAVVVTQADLSGEKIAARFREKLDAGHSAQTALTDLRLTKDPLVNRGIYRRFVQEIIAQNILPPKAEAAFIRASRARGMVKAVAENDFKGFAKLAHLAIKDPALNLQEKQQPIVIKLQDVQSVLADDADVIEIDYTEVSEEPAADDPQTIENKGLI